MVLSNDGATLYLNGEGAIGQDDHRNCLISVPTTSPFTITKLTKCNAGSDPTAYSVPSSYNAAAAGQPQWVGTESGFTRYPRGLALTADGQYALWGNMLQKAGASYSTASNEQYIRARFPMTIKLLKLDHTLSSHPQWGTQTAIQTIAGHDAIAGLTDGDCSDARFALIVEIRLVPNNGNTFIIREHDNTNADMRKLTFSLSDAGVVSNCRVYTLGDVVGMRGFTLLDEFTAMYLTKSKVMTADLRMEIPCHRNPKLLAGLADMKVSQFGTPEKFLPDSGSAGVHVKDGSTWLFTGYRKVRSGTTDGNEYALVKDAVCSKSCGPPGENGEVDCASSQEPTTCCVGKMGKVDVTETEAEAKWLQSSSGGQLIEFEDDLKVW